jgi:hypothetical protein
MDCHAERTLLIKPSVHFRVSLIKVAEERRAVRPAEGCVKEPGEEATEGKRGADCQSRLSHSAVHRTNTKYTIK